MSFLAKLKLWWESHLRYRRNYKVLKKHAKYLATRFSKYRIDVTSDSIEACMEQLESCELQAEAAKATADLFAGMDHRIPPSDPFGRYGRRENVAEKIDRFKEDSSATR